MNVIKPIFWIIFSLVLFIFLPNQYINKKKDKKVIELAFLTGLSYTIIYSLFGIWVTFGKNPYSITIKGILTNLWITGVVIVGREYARFKILRNTPKKNQTFVSILIIIVFSLLELDVASLIESLSSVSNAFRQIVSGVIPIVIKNILFTKIVSKYSYKAPIVYELTINLFYWLMPILPNSPWILIAILDTTILFIFFILIKNKIDEEESLRRKIPEESANPKSTIMFCFVLVIVACFSVGIFPIQPRAVATGSMYPELSIGDVVFIRKCGINDIKIGNIIEYSLENQFIIHRVIDIDVEDSKFFITTKGDNNSSEDANTVSEEQLIGKVIFKIKYVGLPSIWLHNLINEDEEVLVETGR